MYDYEKFYTDGIVDVEVMWNDIVFNINDKNGVKDTGLTPEEVIEYMDKNLGSAKKTISVEHYPDIFNNPFSLLLHLYDIDGLDAVVLLLAHALELGWQQDPKYNKIIAYNINEIQEYINMGGIDVNWESRVGDFYVCKNEKTELFGIYRNDGWMMAPTIYINCEVNDDYINLYTNTHVTKYRCSSDGSNKIYIVATSKSSNGRRMTTRRNSPYSYMSKESLLEFNDMIDDNEPDKILPASTYYELFAYDYYIMTYKQWFEKTLHINDEEDD